jgi:hypothetical protein
MPPNRMPRIPAVPIPEPADDPRGGAESDGRLPVLADGVEINGAALLGLGFDDVDAEGDLDPEVDVDAEGDVDGALLADPSNTKRGLAQTPAAT